MKPTLIFIHGFRGNALGLKEIAKKFPKKSFNVHILEVPPAGNNTLKEYTARLYARFVAEYIKENKLEKPILIGHSMGSIVAAAVAERYPDLIADKIVFMSPISVKPNKFFSALTPFSAIMPNKFVGFITTKYLYVPKSDKELSKEVFKKTLDATFISGKDYTTRLDVYRSAKFSTQYSISDFTFDKKALFLSGEKDHLIPSEKTKKTAKKFNAKEIYIKDTGHLLNFENPSAVAKEIKKFLKS